MTSKGQTQFDFAIGFFAFFLFLSGTVLLPYSPLFIGDLYSNTLSTEAHHAASTVSNSELTNENGEITDKKINDFLTSDPDTLTQSDDIRVNVTFSNADNPAGDADNKGKLPKPFGNNNPTVGEPTPSTGIHEESKYINVNGKLVEVIVTVWWDK